ncbi:MAG: hypothetical protein AB1646_08625 [Thermodesulfobacteriota bacterium]
MFEQLWKLLSGNSSKADAEPPVMTVEGPPPDEVTVGDRNRFGIASHITRYRGLPIVNWREVDAWIYKLPFPHLQAEAWAECELAWLLHLRDALGPGYRLDQIEGTSLVSSLEPELAHAALLHMWHLREAILCILPGIARVPQWGTDILLILDDERLYYRYVSYYYPKKGEFSRSGAMFIDKGCAHCVTVKSDLYVEERAITHEMVHSYLAYLPLPLWLNEGITVNVEGRPGPDRRHPEETRWMLDKHAAFWHGKEIQEFWSGKSFSRPGGSNVLSYDLAGMMVEELAKDWDAFSKFVLAADRFDAGAGAALKHMGIDLGEFVKYMLYKKSSANWSPDPKTCSDW